MKEEWNGGDEEREEQDEGLGGRGELGGCGNERGDENDG